MALECPCAFASFEVEIGALSCATKYGNRTKCLEVRGFVIGVVEIDVMDLELGRMFRNKRAPSTGVFQMLSISHGHWLTSVDVRLDNASNKDTSRFDDIKR
jgi:hypothetical protein